LSSFTRVNRLSTVLAFVVSLGLAAAGCGGPTSEEQAETDVCEAIADIRARVDELQGLTVNAATAGQLRGDVAALEAALDEIDRARDQLSADAKGNVQAASDVFRAAVQRVADNLEKGLSQEGARREVNTAIEELPASLRATLGGFTCR
jgi:uncharacterized protein YhaN